MYCCVLRFCYTQHVKTLLVDRMADVSEIAGFVMAGVTVLKIVVMSWAVTVPLDLCVTALNVYHGQKK